MSLPIPRIVYRLMAAAGLLLAVACEAENPPVPEPERPPTPKVSQGV